MKTFSTIFTFVFLIAFLSSSIAQISWTKDPNNPIMSGGNSGSWNRHMIYVSVLYNEDSTRYEMWYSASDDPVFDRPWRIGFATSTDGIIWDKHPVPVLEPTAGTWDAATVEGQTVIRENGIYKMWYVSWGPSDPGGIGYAWSNDGINWKKDTLNNPVIVPSSAAWEAGGYGGCNVLHVQGEYKIWYGAYNTSASYGNIGYATSTNGVTWTPDSLNNPVIRYGSFGSWDSGVVNAPQVLFINNKYYMWYYGSQPGEVMPYQVGQATSVYGIQWHKYNDLSTTSTLYSESDPVLQPSSGQWDGDAVITGTVMIKGDSLRMWYSGTRKPLSTYPFGIGHATAPFDTVTGINYNDLITIPQRFFLAQNYPNPFNPSTTIEFTLAKSEYVELKVYNILGKEVSTLVSKKLNQGSHSYTFDGRNLASGIYYYRIEAGNFIQTHKMIYLK